MSQGFSTYLPALKEMVQDFMEEEAYSASPLLALIEHDKNFFGESYRVPLSLEDVQGVSGRFADAQSGAAAGQSLLRAFSVTHAQSYSLARISGQLIRRGQKNSIIQAMEHEMKSALNSLACDLSHQLYRAGYGSRGTIVYTSGTTFACTNADDIAHVKVGMRLVASASLAGNALRSSTALTVTAVDEDANTVTMSAAPSTLSWASGDTIFRAGDRDDSATPSKIIMTGLGGWNPVTAPDSTSFFGVDRTININRTAGGRWSPTSYNAEELLIDLLRRAERRGAKLSHIMCGTAFYAQVAKAMQSRGVVPLVEVKTAKPGIGFTGINVQSAHGQVTLLADIYCPPDEVRGLNVKNLKVATAGDTMRLADEDADKITLSSEDTYEVRLVSEGNFIPSRPLDLFVAKLPSAPS